MLKTLVISQIFMNFLEIILWFYTKLSLSEILCKTDHFYHIILIMWVIFIYTLIISLSSKGLPKE
jgi:hypothetical protein